MEKVSPTDPADIDIKFTQDAIDQLGIIIENDYTFENMIFRLKIDGKGCNGFDYALGFTEKFDGDINVIIPNTDDKLSYYIDPFTAFYSKKGVVDFVQDIENDSQGFIFENDNEKQYRGKFFKDESKAPPIV